MPATKPDPFPRVALFDLRQADATITWHQGVPVSRRRLLHSAREIAKGLPDHAYAINLCADRYYFLLGFVAVLLAGQTNLLPANQLDREVEALKGRYGDSYALTDQRIESALQDARFGPLDGAPPPLEVPRIAAAHTAAIVFTSGSTGSAQAHEKRWGDLVIGARLALERFGLNRAPAATIVATVPSQHMYGLEMSVLLPLVGGLRSYNGRPFYPLDIVSALGQVPAPRLLVTTPLHLRACVHADIEWPAIQGIVSSTAPLSSELAMQAEQASNSPLQEVYGCTETGFIASRRTSRECNWKLLEGVGVDVKGTGARVRGAQFPAPVQLHDFIELRGESEFSLLGRRTDLIKVGGKRISLADLNYKLTSIDGVRDGVIFMPKGSDDPRIRVAGLVVAPQLGVGEILAALSARVDRVFLPRPLYRVPCLPRTEAGKLPRDELLKLYTRLCES